MSDTLGKIVARVPAATSSTSNLFASQRALLAGVGHISLVSDLNHLANITSTGVVFTHQGVVGFYRGPNGGTLSSPPLPSEVVWNAVGPDPGALNYRIDLRVDPYTPATLPVLRLRCFVVAPPSGTESVGVVLCVGTLPSDSSRYDSAIVTNTSGEDVTLEIPLQQTDLTQTTRSVTLGYTSTGVPVLGEPQAESTVRAWIGFVNTSDKNSDTANAVGIVLSLEYPT